MLWVKGVFTLLLFQSIGELIKYLTGVLLPGPVIGMFLLFGFLIIKRGVSDSLQQVSIPMIQSLTIMFVPPTVGMYFLGDGFNDQWLPFIAAGVGTTMLGTAIVAFGMKKVLPAENDPHA